MENEIDIKRSYYESGQLYYEEGALDGWNHGPQKSWDENGNPRYCNMWKNGESDGLWMHWNEDGTRFIIQVKKPDFIRNGVLIGFKYEK